MSFQLELCIILLAFETRPQTGNAWQSLLFIEQSHWWVTLPRWGRPPR